MGVFGRARTRTFLSFVVRQIQQAGGSKNGKDSAWLAADFTWRRLRRADSHRRRSSRLFHGAEIADSDLNRAVRPL